MRNPETASIIERLIACRDTLKVVEGQFAVNLQPERAVMADAANALDAYDKTMQRIAEAPSPTPPAGDGWEPIETAPKDSSAFIGWNGSVRQWTRWLEGEWWSPESHFEWTPTHWRPLPTPPAKGEKL